MEHLLLMARSYQWCHQFWTMIPGTGSAGCAGVAGHAMVAAIVVVVANDDDHELLFTWWYSCCGVSIRN